jgi:hypothetical protein
MASPLTIHRTVGLKMSGLVVEKLQPSFNFTLEFCDGNRKARMSDHEGISALRDAYLERLDELGLDLPLKDHRPKDYPEPFASGTFDPKAVKLGLRMLEAERHYANWPSVTTEPRVNFLARLAGVKKTSRSFLGARLPYAQSVLDDQMAEVRSWLKLQDKMLPCEVFAGLFPTGELNARIAPVAGKGALLLVNVGLMDLIFSLLKINIATPAPGETQPLLTGEQAMLALVEVFNAYLYGEGSLGAWPLPRLPEERERPLDFVLRRCEQFVLCHEIGHLVLNHISIDGPETHHRIGDYTPAQEREADSFAVALMTRAHKNGPLWERRSPFLAGAIMTFFAIAMVVGMLQEELNLVDAEKESHPDLEERMNAIADQLETELPGPDLFRPAEVFRSWLLTNTPEILAWLTTINSSFRRPDPWE